MVFVQNSNVVSVLQYPSFCTPLSTPFLLFSELSVKQAGQAAFPHCVDMTYGRVTQRLTGSYRSPQSPDPEMSPYSPPEGQPGPH